jgi:L-threonylcarbamoyladenylate synthase
MVHTAILSCTYFQAVFHLVSLYTRQSSSDLKEAVIMSAQIIPLSPDDPRDDRITHAASILEQGGIVALPTETFYGLAADSFNPDALQNLNRIKRKDADSPLLLMLSDRSMANQVAEDLPESFHVLARAFWPGPLTLVVRCSESVPKEVSGGRGTVGMRVPGMALPRHLAAALGRPITGISSNIHRNRPHRNAVEVYRTFPEGVDMVLDGGPTPGGAPSTIIDLTGDRPLLLRVGTLPFSVLVPFLPELAGLAVKADLKQI